MANENPHQILTVTGGLNSDTGAASFPVGGSPFRLNVRVLSTNEDNDGYAETVLGNTLVPFTLPTGDNTCIGYCEDKLRNKGYAFIYNESSHHSILEYDEQTQIIKTVLRNAPSFDTSSFPLNFKLGFLITGCEVVELDKDNHLLYWTDGYINPADASDYNEPKKINIEYGLLYISSSGTDKEGYLNPFDKHWIDRIKEPPSPPTYVWTGIGLGTSVWKVTSHFGVTSTVPATPAIFTFDQILSGTFNIGAHTGTAPFTGYYTVTVNMQISGTGVSTNGLLTVRQNGTSIVSTLSVSLGATTTPSTVTLISDPISLTAGDDLSVWVETSDNPLGWSAGNSTFFPVGFSAEFLGATNREIPSNDLFKRGFQFQLDYGYKDKERSVLSSKTDYILPKTSQTSGTGEDYTVQDNAIVITINTGSSQVKDINIYGHEIGQVDTDTLADISLIVTIDKKRLGLADNVSYDYIFLNDANYTPISLEKKNQLYDFIFYYEKALCVFKSKLADANGAEGMDAVEIDMRLPMDFSSQVDEYPENPFFPKRSYLKSGGIYQYGTVYKANGKRLGNANTTNGSSDEVQPNGRFGTRLNVPFLTETAYTAPHLTPNTDMKYVPTVKGWLYNHPPQDATEYEIVRSKNQAISNFIQFWGELNIPIFNDNRVMIVGLNNITGRYKDENPQSELVYEWTKGDRIRLIADVKIVYPTQIIGELQTFHPFNDSEIIQANSFNNDPDLDPLNVKFPLVSVPIVYFLQLYELYTPAKNILNDNELVFEVCERGTIGTDIHGNKIHKPYNNGKTVKNQLFGTFTSNTFTSPPTLNLVLPTGHGFSSPDNVKVIGVGWSIYGIITGQTATTVAIDTTGFTITGTHTTGGGEIVKCSEQEFTSGDCFRRLCDMPLALTNSPVARLYSYIETMNASNMFPSEFWDYGRPNRIDNDAKRSLNKAMVRYTQSFIPNTNINGLSTCFDDSFKTYSSQFGGILYMFYQNERIIVWQTLKTLPILAEQQLLASPAGGGVLSGSPETISTQQDPEYYTQDFGTQHPESIAHFGNRKYCLDVLRNAVVRLSQDGLIPISTEAGMSVFMANLCTKILLCPDHVNCIGVYDTRFGEYVLSVAPFTYGDGLIFSGVTISFNEAKNLFSTQWSYLPDFMGQSGIDIISFKNGSLWTHNTNELVANFYGVKVDPILEFICNEFPNDVKVYLSLEENSDDVWVCEKITTPKGQETRMIYPSNWTTKENLHYSALKKDINTPVVVNPIVAGNPIRDTSCRVRLKYLGTTFSVFKTLSVYFIPSNRHNK